jgi:hypothetical protein
LSSAFLAFLFSFFLAALLLADEPPAAAAVARHGTARHGTTQHITSRHTASQPSRRMHGGATPRCYSLNESGVGCKPPNRDHDCCQPILPCRTAHYALPKPRLQCWVHGEHT